ncbi:MAG: hypothetical protein Q9207_003967 [Kuettlingeria erythrocarpa]
MSEKDIETLELALKVALGKESQEAGILSTELHNQGEVNKAFSLVLENQKRIHRPDIIDQVRFLLAVYHLAGSDANLTAYLWKRRLSGLDELAESYYTLPEDAPKVPDGTLSAFKEKLYSLKPTPVLLGLLLRDTIKLPEEDGVHPEATALAKECLKMAVQDGFDISRQPAPPMLETAFAKIAEARLEDGTRANGVVHEAGLSSDKPVVEVFVYALQRLQALVRIPEDVGLLLRIPYLSADAIAKDDSFVEIMEQEGMPVDSATRIQDHATNISVRNEQAWADALRERNEVTLPYVTVKSKDLPSSKREGAFSSAQSITLTTLFRDMDNVECSDCSSVLSPAAYFVDLLRLLQETSSARKHKSSPSLLEKLLERRPDLQHLELSCANTNSLIAYIDLVDEVLESYIDHLSGREEAKDKSIVVHNTPADEAGDNSVQAGQPRHVNFGVYQRALQPEVYPLTTFPYNQAIDTIRSLLLASGTSRYDVMCIFASEDVALKQIKPQSGKSWAAPDLLQFREHMKAAMNRSLAAECLGLQQEDFMAVTKETFHSRELLQEQLGRGSMVSNDDYRKAFAVKPAATLWGYRANETHSMLDLMLDEETGDGLTFIKAQLLPRSALSMKELQEILKTQFLSGRLIVTTSSFDNVFTGKLDDMRLRCSTLADVNSSTLTEDLCHDLQAFIRLWRKTGWSIADLDAILSTLKRGDGRASVLPLRPQSGITPGMIEDVAAIKQLSGICQTEVSRLQPLWADIDTNGPGSLYARLFLHPRMTKMDPVFKPETPGRCLRFKNKTMIGQHKQVLLATLGISEKDLSMLYTCSNLGPDPELTLSNVSAIYRTSLFCHIAGITPVGYQAFCGLFSDDDIFGSPRSTLRVLERWQQVQNTGWSLPEMYHDQSADENEKISTLALGAVTKMYSGAAATEKLYALDPTKAQGSAEDVIKFASLLFDSAAATQTCQLVEGTWSVASDVVLEAAEKKIPVTTNLGKKLSSQVSFDQPQKVRIVLHGLLSNDEVAAAHQLVPGSAAWGKTVDHLNGQSKAIFKALVERVFPSEETVIDAFLGTGNDFIASRRQLFLQHAGPILMAQQLQQIVMDNVSVDFAIDAAILLPLLTDIVRTKQGVTALAALQSLVPQTSSTPQYDGYIILAASGDYTFVVESNITPTLTINGVEVDFTQASGSWTSESTPLLSGKIYPCSYGGDMRREVSYVAPGALAPSKMSNDMLVSKQAWKDVNEIYTKLQIATKIIQRYQLKLYEVEYLCQRTSHVHVDFVTINMQQMTRLGRYKTVRDACSEAQKTGDTLISLFKWASSAKIEPADLPQKIARATGWSVKQVADIIAAKRGGWDKVKLVELFQTEDELFQMYRMIKLIEKMRLPTLEVYTLFRIAAPLPMTAELPAVEDDLNFSNAAILRLASQTSASDAAGPFAYAYNQVRERQRTSLVHYLLHHETIQKRKLVDADSLFEWFLIDVQMGAKLQTSRMKQAISTVQLYIQRCMLGLEKSMGVESNTVSHIRWKYMSKYTLWEANRKLFLYPENWIDPTLRDNKTDHFRALEVSILQNNLNSETVSAAIKSYIYGVNEIAALNVQSYLWEKKDNNKSLIHVFARTKQTPYQYYYRWLELTIVRSNATATTMKPTSTMSTITTVPSEQSQQAGKPVTQTLRKWSSWSKIDVDIPALDTDMDGNTLQQPGSYLVPAVIRGRLFLFIPQFLLKSATKDDDETSLFDRAHKTGKPKVDKFWEIQLGQSEYRNGKWSPKQTASAHLRVPGIKASPTDPIPPLSSFRFFTNTCSSTELQHQDAATDDVIVIDIESWYEDSREGEKTIPIFPCPGDAPKIKQWPLGRFKIQERKVTVTDATDLPQEVVRQSKDEKDKFDTDDELTVRERRELMSLKNDASLPTYFSKVWGRSTAPEPPAMAPRVRRGAKIDTVLMARTTGQSVTQRDYHWTMSFNAAHADKLTALVLEVSTRTQSSTYLGFPTDENASSAENIEPLDHPLSSALMEYSTTSDSIDSVFNFLSTIGDATKRKISFGGLESGYNEQATPYSIYNWELGMHAVSLIMERLFATQQFELALDVARLVFDPTVDGTNLERCWRFLPFKDTALAGATPVTDTLNALEPKIDSVTRAAEVGINEWKENPFVGHAVARSRPVVYMKRFVIKYIEVLIASGDEYFRQNSLESIPLAIQRYVEASHLFGPAPQQVPKLGKLAVKTFAQLDKSLDVFANAKVDMELEFPYSSEPCYRGTLIPKLERQNRESKSGLFMGHVNTGYFCVPPNPQVTALRNLIDDRFYKIRNSLDVDGKPLTLALFDPPLDPGILAKAQAAGLSPSVLLNDLEAPMPNYRFLYLLQKALDMCNELKSMGEQFLAAKEKKDAEALNMLHARHDVLSNTALLPIKELQKIEVSKSIDALEEMRKSHCNRLAFYLALVGESTDKVPDEKSEWTDLVQSIEKPSSDDLRMSPYEKVDMDKSDSAAKYTDTASILELAASGLMALPNLATNMSPMGVGVQVKFDAENAAKLMTGTSAFMKLKAQMDSHDGQRAVRKGAMVRQLQDRKLQANQAAHDVKHIDKEIAVQRVRMEVCESEIKAQRRQLERASELQEWHRTKYTNETLYAWLENSFRTLYYESFRLAMQLARRAERAFQFESPSQGGNDKLSYLGQGGYWDSGRDGLLSAQNLFLSLKRLEMAYVEKRTHDFELVKNVSLRQVDPMALMALRLNGTTSFSLPEVIFDLDFPGHYLRRLKSVAVSIPCIVGPYTGLNCTLSLLEHRLRMSSSLPYAYQGRDDPHFHTDRIPISSIATSSGQNDSGVFELGFHDERYLPFEGAGALSKWKLEFPAYFRQFDYNTISDVVLHLRFTAMDGGAALRDAANQAVKAFTTEVAAAEEVDGGLFAWFDLRNDFCNEWFEMMKRSGGGKRHIRLPRIAERLPFWTKGKRPTIRRMAVMLAKPSDTWAAAVSMAVLSQTTGKSSTVDFGVADGVNMEGVTVLMGASAANEPHPAAEDEFQLMLGDDGVDVPENVYVVFRYTTS